MPEAICEIAFYNGSSIVTSKNKSSIGMEYRLPSRQTQRLRDCAIADTGLTQLA